MQSLDRDRIKKSNLRLEVVYRPPAALTDNERNPRKHPPQQLKHLQKSIEAFGFIIPVIIDEDLKIVGGHACVAVARKMNLADIPTIRIEHLTKEQQQAFMLALNRLSGLAEWDDQLLGEVLQELSLADLDFDIEATGFSIPEIDIRIEGLTSSADRPDAADVLPHVSTNLPVSRPGDLWLLGRHRLLCGSALDTAAYVVLMNGELASAMFTDPPYNVAIDGNVGGLTDGADLKTKAAERWIGAVNRLGQYGKWHYLLVTDPSSLGMALNNYTTAQWDEPDFKLH